MSHQAIPIIQPKKQLFFFTVVTGGSEGIGFAYAKELARRHLNIILISRSMEKLQKARKLIGKYSSCR